MLNDCLFRLLFVPLFIIIEIEIASENRRSTNLSDGSKMTLSIQGKMMLIISRLQSDLSHRDAYGMKSDI